MTDDKTLPQRFTEAWASIENPELDGTNPRFNNRYATLKSTLAVVRAACKPAGIMYLQTLRHEDDAFVLRSAVMDAKGDLMTLSEFPVENVPNSQAFGSEMTYKKRQQAQADWGITGEEDEDGEAITAAQTGKAGKDSKKAKSTRQRSSGGSSQPSANKWEKLTALKAEALQLGITEEGMKGAMNNVLQGKPLKDAADVEIKACEAVIASLVRDKKELLGIGAENA